MRPAGMKSNNDVDFRQDSVEYLDRNRAKTITSRPNLYENHRLNSSQSGRINEAGYSSTRSAFGDYPDLISDNTRYDLEKYSNPTPTGRPSSANPDARATWSYIKKPDVFELDVHKYK
jgi:hypothetical protein